MSITHVNIHEHHPCQHSWASLMSININIHEHHSCQSASKASFQELQLRKLHLQSSDFKSFIYKSSSFKASLLKLHLQSFSAWYTKTASEQPPLQPIHGLNLKSPANMLYWLKTWGTTLFTIYWASATGPHEKYLRDLAHYLCIEEETLIL